MNRTRISVLLGAVAMRFLADHCHEPIGVQDVVAVVNRIEVTGRPLWDELVVRYTQQEVVSDVQRPESLGQLQGPEQLTGRVEHGPSLRLVRQALLAHPEVPSVVETQYCVGRAFLRRRHRVQDPGHLLPGRVVIDRRQPLVAESRQVPQEY